MPTPTVLYHSKVDHTSLVTAVASLLGKNCRNSFCDSAILEIATAVWLQLVLVLENHKQKKKRYGKLT